MLFESSPSPLRPGQSYPITKRALDAALRERGVDVVRQVGWIHRHDTHRADLVLLAQYDGLDARQATTHANRPGTVTMTILSVPSEERAEVEKALLEHGLGPLAAWLAQIADRPETWRTEPHDLAISISGGKVHVSEEKPGPPWKTIQRDSV
jgi:hypothetical protein